LSSTSVDIESSLVADIQVGAGMCPPIPDLVLLRSLVTADLAADRAVRKASYPRTG